MHIDLMFMMIESTLSNQLASSHCSSRPTKAFASLLFRAMDLFQQYTVPEWKQWVDAAHPDELCGYSTRQWKDWIQGMHDNAQTIEALSLKTLVW